MRTGFVGATAAWAAGASHGRPAALLGAVVIGAAVLVPVAPDPLPPPVRTVQLDIAMTSVPLVNELTGVVTALVKTVARILLLPALPVLIGAVLYQQTSTCYSNSSCGRDPLFQLSGLIVKVTTALTASAVPAAAQVPTRATPLTASRKATTATPHRTHGTVAAQRSTGPAKTSVKSPQSKRGQGHSARS